MLTTPSRRKYTRRSTYLSRLLDQTFVSTMKNPPQDNEPNYTLRFEKLIADVSSRFAASWSDQIDHHVSISLKKILKFTGADQCGFFTVDLDKGKVSLSHLECVDAEISHKAAIEFDQACSWIYETLMKRTEPFLFQRLSDFPNEARTGTSFIEAGGVQAGVYIPFFVDSVVRHVFVLCSNREQPQWPAHLLNHLKILGGIFVNALSRKNVFEALQRNTLSLHEAEQFAQSTLNALHKFVCVINTSGIVVKLSERWPAFGKANIEPPISVAVGANYFLACELMTGCQKDSIAMHMQSVRAVLCGEIDEVITEFSADSATEQRWFSSKASRFLISGVAYVAISHIDITDEKRRVQELENLRTQQWHTDRISRTGVLIASLAHELSQPLAAILNNAQAGLRYIATNKMNDVEMGAILTDIVFDEKRAGKIIDALRNMLRRQKTECTVVDAADIVLDVLTILYSELVKHRVMVESECDEGCFVLADRSQIQQVVLNLIMNAIDAMQTQPLAQRYLRVRVQRTDEGEVKIAVRDSGSGISQENREKIFDAFWTSKSTGTGMGLAICRSIIESHGGRIWVESKIGQGSTFLFSLQATTPFAIAADLSKNKT